MLQNFKILKDPFQAGIPHCDISNFTRDFVLFGTYNGPKFEFCAFSSLNLISQLLKIDANSETLCRFDTVEIKFL